MLADPGDDVNNITIPSEETTGTNNIPATKKGVGKDLESTKSNIDDSMPQKDRARRSANTSKNHHPNDPTAKPMKQKYPLYPSVTQILHERGFDITEADKIPATGPNGRLLKGDVLVYLGELEPSYMAKQSDRIARLGRLDLSNIKVAAAQKPDPPVPIQDTNEKSVTESELDSEIVITISLKTVQEVQQRIHDALGICISLETFIARAVEISNTDLPRRSTVSLTSDDLFSQVLGLNKIVPKYSQGNFMPLVGPPRNALTKSLKVTPTRSDIIDILTVNSPRRSMLARSSGIVDANDGSTANVFSVTVQKGDERRARIFLERVKTILQVDPGRLIL